MPLLDFCHVCNMKNPLNGTDKFNILVHYYDNYIVCDKKECIAAHDDHITNDEIDSMIYISYMYKGKTTNIQIPRTDGSVSIGKIENRLSTHDFLHFKKNIPWVKVVFEDNDIAKTKDVSYKDLARYNLHLPMPSISCRSSMPDTIARFNKTYESIYNKCVWLNRATKLIWCAHHHDDGSSFSCLPKELVMVIIKFYFR